MPQTNSSIIVQFDALKDFISRALQANGLSPEHANKVASLMAQADLQGSDGHGVIRLPQYVKRIRAGGSTSIRKLKLCKTRPRWP